MPLPSSGQITMAQINAEFGRGTNLNAYRGTTYFTSSGGPFTFPSGQIAFSDFWGTQATSPAGTFSPNGGTSAGAAVFLFDYENFTDAVITITCTQNATWNYTRVFGPFGQADLPSGSTATSITFSVPLGGSFRQTYWTLNATSGSNTRFWELSLETEPAN